MLWHVPWVNDSTIPGWYAAQTIGTLANYDAGNGSSNVGGLYSFGINGISTNDERALGAVSSGSTGTVLYGVQFRNNTTNTINSISIRYTGEQWRNSGTNAPQTVDLQYQVGATSLTTGSWTGVNALSFTSPVFSTTAAALDGNFSANRTLVTSSSVSVTVNPGQDIWLRWSDIDHTGADHGLAIDDLSVSTTFTTSSQPVPEPMDFMGTIVAIFAVAILKRKFSARKTAR
jgi:hypothetical protein